MMQSNDEESQPFTAELGSIKPSLRLMPYWYQIVSIVFSALIPFFLNDFVVLSWASTQLHFDFGTSTLWTSSRGSTAYYDMVNRMTIRERLGFAGYALCLVGIVALISKALFSLPQQPTPTVVGASSLGGSKKFSIRGSNEEFASSSAASTPESTVSLAQHRELFPHRPNLAKGLYALHLLEMLLLMKHIITECIESPLFSQSSKAASTTSPVGVGEPTTGLWATFAIADVTQYEMMDFNPHVVIQLDIILRLLTWWVRRVALPAVLVFCYRAARDIRSRKVHSIRWFSITFSVARTIVLLVDLAWNEEMLASLIEVFSTVKQPVAAQEKVDVSGGSSLANVLLWSDVIMMTTTVVLVGAVNIIYGPTKRSSNTLSVSTVKTLLVGIFRMVLQCAFTSLMCACMVMMVAVGVHIVELLLLWLFTFCALIWIPAALDSCSFELMLFFACVAAFINEYAPTTTVGAKFFVDVYGPVVVCLVFLLMLMVSMLHNVGHHLLGSRSASIALLITSSSTMGFSCYYYIFYVQSVESTANSENSSWRAWFHRLGNKTHPAATRSLNYHVIVPFAIAVSSAVVVLACAAVNEWISARQRGGAATVGSNVAHQSKRCAPICTASLLVKKMMHLVVFCGILSASIWGSVVAYNICGTWCNLPLESERLIAAVCGTALFGALTDMTASAYQFLLRAIGLVDPPAGQDGNPDVSGIEASLHE